MGGKPVRTWWFRTFWFRTLRWLCAAALLGLWASWSPSQHALAGAPPAFELRLEPVSTELQLPVYAAEPPDGSGRLFIVQLDGLIRIMRGGELLDRPFLSLRDRMQALEGEQGLYSIAFHPDFGSNGRFFVSYAQRDTGHLIVAEYHAKDDDPDLARPDGYERILLDLPSEDPFHYGGQLAFGPDGYLYVGVGNGLLSVEAARHRRPPSQDLSSLRGSLLRLDVDGTGTNGAAYAVPPDNPFVATPGARPEIYAYGFRNPWKFSFDRGTGELYLSDVGGDRWEEIDLIEAGGNYGWPEKEGPGCVRFPQDGALVAPGCPGHSDTLPPLVAYQHLAFDQEGGNAVTGGYVYRGTRYPALVGRYFFGDFVSGRIWCLERSPDGRWRRRALLDTDLAISSFVQDAAGELYVLDLHGGLYHLAAGAR